MPTPYHPPPPARGTTWVPFKMTEPARRTRSAIWSMSSQVSFEQSMSSFMGAVVSRSLGYFVTPALRVLVYGTPQLLDSCQARESNMVVTQTSCFPAVFTRASPSPRVAWLCSLVYSDVVPLSVDASSALVEAKDDGVEDIIPCLRALHSSDFGLRR